MCRHNHVKSTIFTRFSTAYPRHNVNSKSFINRNHPSSSLILIGSQQHRHYRSILGINGADSAKKIITDDTDTAAKREQEQEKYDIPPLDLLSVFDETSKKEGGNANKQPPPYIEEKDSSASVTNNTATNENDIPPLDLLSLCEQAKKRDEKDDVLAASGLLNVHEQAEKKPAEVELAASTKENKAVDIPPLNLLSGVLPTQKRPTAAVESTTLNVATSSTEEAKTCNNVLNISTDDGLNDISINGTNDTRKITIGEPFMPSIEAKSQHRTTKTPYYAKRKVSTSDFLHQHLNPQDSYAIFIDAQSSSNVKDNELAFRHMNDCIPSHSLSSVKRIYGDVASLKKLSLFVSQYGLHVPYRYPDESLPNLHNIDGLMIMDIIEAIYKHPHIKAFIIFASDGDFVPLVYKLREAGKIVIVYGRRKSTSSALQSACHHYVNTEDLVLAHEARIRNEKLLNRQKGKELAKMLAIERHAKKVQCPMETKQHSSSLEKNPDVNKDSGFFKPILSFVRDLFTVPWKNITVNRDSSVFANKERMDVSTAQDITNDKSGVTTEASFPGALDENDVSSKAPLEVPKFIRDEIVQIILEHKKDDGSINNGILGKKINFKKLGYKSMSELLEDVPEVRLSPNRNYVQLSENTSKSSTKDGTLYPIKDRTDKNAKIRTLLRSLSESKDRNLAAKSQSKVTQSMKDDIIQLVIKHSKNGFTNKGMIANNIDYKKLGYKTVSHLLKEIPEIQSKKDGNYVQLSQTAKTN